MIVSCFNCGKTFQKANNQIKRSPNHFCSRSCAANVNNKIYKKRKRTKKCKCGELILSDRKKCVNCIENLNKDRKLCEITYKKLHRSSAYALVRSMARTFAKKMGWISCCKCGYDKHIEIAHIKPISSFLPDDKISEINSINNLLPLCPNCHWEFDNLSER